MTEKDHVIKTILQLMKLIDSNKYKKNTCALKVKKHFLHEKSILLKNKYKVKIYIFIR